MNMSYHHYRLNLHVRSKEKAPKIIATAALGACILFMTVFWLAGERITGVPMKELRPHSAARRALLQEQQQPLRVLHVVTSLAEYNNGYRGTVKGEDRLKKVLIPTLQATIESITQKTDWHVDVYLVLGFTLSYERRQLIVDALPDHVGLEVWNDAAPIYYDVVGSDTKLVLNTRALARQHRFVIKDKLEYYDLFSCWEDDMKIMSDHMQNFLETTEDLKELRSKAPEIKSQGDNGISGVLSAGQLLNSIPGFIRVEVLKDGASSQLQKQMDLIEVDDSVRTDGKYCCDGAPSEKLVLWETGIVALGVRKFPGNELGWMSILPGSHARDDDKISTYWSGEDGAYGNTEHPGG